MKYNGCMVLIELIVFDNNINRLYKSINYNSQQKSNLNCCWNTDYEIHWKNINISGIFAKKNLKQGAISNELIIECKI